MRVSEECNVVMLKECAFILSIPKEFYLSHTTKSPTLYKNTIPTAPTPTTATVAHPICILPPVPVNGIAAVLVMFVAEEEMLDMAYGAADGDEEGRVEY